MEEFKVETIEYKGYKIHVYYDIDAESPREWDNLGTVMYFHNRYKIGDKHNFPSPEYFLEDITDLSDSKIDELLDKSEGDKRLYYELLINYAEKKNIILPIYMYDHSGVTISTAPFSCPWDSGQVGWIYVDFEMIKREFRRERITQKLIERAKEILQNEVKVLDDYVRGDVYGFQIEGIEDENLLDSCWGYYGDAGKEYMIEECKSTINYHIKSHGS